MSTFDVQPTQPQKSRRFVWLAVAVVVILAVVALAVTLTRTSTQDSVAPASTASSASVPAASTCQDNRAGVVVDFGDTNDPQAGPEPSPAVTWNCLSPLPSGLTGVQLLQQTGHTLRFNPSGLLCAIDNYPARGCAQTQPDGTIYYWSYYTYNGTGAQTWNYASVGPASRVLSNNYLDGWRYVASKGAGATPTPRQAPDWSVICCTVPGK